MRMVFLGTGGSLETPQRHTTGLYLPDAGILLDAGTNVFPLRELHDERPLTVLMSHYHADHSIGLFFLSAGLFHGRSGGRAEPEVTVYGPDWIDRFEQLGGPESPLFPIPLRFPLKRAPDRFRIGDVEVRTCPVPHGPPVLAYRLTFPDGQSLAYVTDTTAPGDYVDFLRGADVLVHECTFSREHADWAKLTRHTEASALGKLAREAEVGTLFLTHVGPLENGFQLLAEVREEFPRAELPVEGVVYPSACPVDPHRAIFPGSFDPLTVSHIDIIETCVEMFSTVHVVVARNPAKDHTALFTPAERAELIRRCVPPSVKVSVWDGLTVDFARAVQAGRIVRGLGRAEDYTVEVRLWKTNALLAPQILTVWLPPRAEHLDVSSSLIKEASLFGGWEGVKHLVPAPIQVDVKARVDRLRQGQPPTATSSSGR